MRQSRFTVPLDTSLFTPIQIQTRFLLWLGMNGWSRWAQEHLVPFRRLIREHNLGVVVMAIDLDFVRPFGFFDADELVVDTGWRARLGGVVLENEILYKNGNELIARGHCTLRPVRLQDAESLAAVPSRLSRTLLEQFHPDEVDRERPERRLPGLVQRFEAGERLIEARSPFTIHRHDCEVADQWSFIDIPSHAAAARERLVAERAGDVPLLGATMLQPLLSVHAEMSRPLFVLDQATVGTSVHRAGDEIGLVHRLFSGQGEHAVVVERFAVGAAG